MPLLDGPDGGLWFDIRGEGEPATVFAHGLTSSSADIAGLTAAVAGTRVLFDFRGHGRSASPPPSAGYGLAAMARDLDHAARLFAATRAVGVSMGAAAILRLLAEDPARFERLVLIIPAWLDAPVPFPAYDELADSLERRPPAEIAGQILAADAVRGLVSRAPAWRERLREQVMRMNAAGMPHALRASAAGEAPVPDVALLRSVTAPVLVLGHEGDASHEASIARRLGEALPNANVRMWAEPLAMLDDFDECARTIAAFLAGNRAPATA